VSHRSGVPSTLADLDLALVIEALARTSCNVTDAAAELAVPAGDLRRLLWAKPQLQEQAFEVAEARLDKAEKNVYEALDSEDSRRRDAASFFVIRNTARAKRRGWLTSASAGAEVSMSVNAPTRIVISWDDTGSEAPLLEQEPLARR
jgi:hypothetical protein